LLPAGERKAIAGIYGVVCLATGQRWIGRAADLDTIKNRLWFTLRQGNHPHPTLQAAWNAHAAESFTLENIERLEEEPLSYVRNGLLEDRLAHWRSTLGAEAI
jgi:hypothetical protein